MRNDGEELLLQIPFHSCNVFQFMLGVVFFNQPYRNSLVELMEISQQSWSALHSSIFYPAFLSSIYGRYSQNTEELNKLYRDLFFGVNTSSNSTVDHENLIRILVISSLDLEEDKMDWMINKYGLQIVAGACADTFTPPREAW